MKQIVVLLLFFTIFSFVFAFFYFHSPQLPQQSPHEIAPTPALPAQSVLRILPERKIVQPGIPTTVDITLQKQTLIPELIQLEIAYDPQVLTNMTIITGNLFDEPLIHFSKINQQTGRISYAVSESASNKSLSDTNTVVTLSFTPILAFKNETTLSFLPKTIIKTNDGTNVLNGAYGAKMMTEDGKFRGQITDDRKQIPERQNIE